MTPSSPDPYATPLAESPPPASATPPLASAIFAQLACWAHGTAMALSLLFLIAATLSVRSSQWEDSATSLFAVLNSGSWLLFLTWTYLAVRHAKSAAPSVMRISPRKAAFIYLVPVGNLYIPYQAMNQLTRAIAPALGLESLVKIWWLLVLITYLLPFYTIMVEQFMKQSGPLLALSFLNSSAYLFLRAGSAMVGIILVLKITRGASLFSAATSPELQPSESQSS